MKKIGILFGQERSFPEAVIKRINEKAEKAQEYLMKLPGRLQKITDRISTPDLQFQFSWVKN